jgi:hypothetical protein
VFHPSIILVNSFKKFLYNRSSYQCNEAYLPFVLDPFCIRRACKEKTIVSIQWQVTKKVLASSDRISALLPQLRKIIWPKSCIIATRIDLSWKIGSAHTYTYCFLVTYRHNRPKIQLTTKARSVNNIILLCSNYCRFITCIAPTIILAIFMHAHKNIVN